MAQYNLERIRKIDICKVAEECGCTLHKSGPRYKTNCPWHADSNPSLVIYPKSQSCYCFACNNGGSVIDFFMARQGVDFDKAVTQLGDSYIKGNPDAFKKTDEPEKKSVPTLHIQRSIVRSTMKAYGINTLVSFLKTLWPERSVERVCTEYMVGTEKRGRTIFWYMSIDGFVRDGKIMGYCSNGKRYKWIDCKGNQHSDINWVSWRMKKDGMLPSDGSWKSRVTLFGEHLLLDPNRKDYPVCIVESEKTCLIGALYNPDYIWMATGTKSKISETLFAAPIIQKRHIIIVPDKDGMGDWAAIARKFVYPDISLCTDTEELSIDEDGDKADIGDIYIRERRKEVEQDKINAI